MGIKESCQRSANNTKNNLNFGSPEEVHKEPTVQPTIEAGLNQLILQSISFQTIKKMNTTKVSTNSDYQQEIHGTRKHSSIPPKSVSRAKKCRFAIASGLILAAVAIIATVCVVVIVIKHGPDMETEEVNSMENLARREAILNKIVEEKRSLRASIQRRPAPNGKNKSSLDKSCYSLMTNDSYPAAHITGRSNKWNKINHQATPDQKGPQYPSDASDYGSYQTHWICSQHHDAFVDGGMYFNQTDKKLYMPLCGYYYISSQMSFTFTTRRNQSFVAHRLNIDRNCPGESNHMTLESRSSLGAPNTTGSTATYVADIVKMCEGGKVSVTIPADTKGVSPCCPYGLQTITFLSAHLVSQSSDCKWPTNRIVFQPPTEKDYERYYNSTSQ